MRSEQFSDYIAKIYDNEHPCRCVSFQVTDACNLCCTYCYQHNKGNHVMPFEVAKKFIDILLEGNNEYINKSNTDGLIVDFIGGEPLLQIELIDQIATYLYDQMIKKNHPWLLKTRMSICSNGLLYFDETVQRILTKWAKYLAFNISIDGNKRLHDSCRVKADGSGSYDIAIAGVKDWMAKGYKMGSKMTLAPENVAYTYEAVVSLIENGYDDINLNCVYEKGWEQEDATTLYYQLKKLADYVIDNKLYDTHYISMFKENIGKNLSPEENGNWCGGTGAMIAVDYKGDIYPCIRYMESSLGDNVKPLIIGNVYDGIMKKQCEKDCVACLNSITRRSQSTDECFDCPIGEGCAWCSAYNYEVFGTPNKRATYICEMHKATVLANVYYWNKVYREKGNEKRFENYCPDEWALKIIPQEELALLKELAGKE